MTGHALVGDVVRPAMLQPEDLARWAEFMEADSTLATPFLSFPYVAAAADTFSGVRVLRITLHGRTVGFFPFQYRSELYRLSGIADRVGGELSDYFGIVAERGLAIDPKTLLRLAGLQAILFTHLDESQAQYGLTGEKPEPGLRIRLARDGASFWSQLKAKDKKFVADTERRERKLAEAHGPLRFVFNHADRLAELCHLITAKRAQYERMAVTDPMSAEVTRRFLERLAASESPVCRAVLSTLHAGETWVASHFGLMCGGMLHYWFPVYNPELRSYAPGRLLVAAIIRSAEDHGVDCIDRGAGDSSAKRDFATEQHSFVRGLWHRPSMSSLIYRVGLSASWRIARQHQLAPRPVSATE
jgi:CelD/BcsL family acetyltransferase involved in cellulose biosynthesis